MPSSRLVFLEASRSSDGNDFVLFTVEVED